MEYLKIDIPDNKSSNPAFISSLLFTKGVTSKLVKSNAKLRNNLGSITVSAIKYTNGDADEATIKLSHDWKIVGNDISGSDAAEKVKEYTKKIITAFGNTTVTA